MQKILMSGRWSVKYRPAFVKQTAKKVKKSPAAAGEQLMVGTPMSSEDGIYNYLHQLGEKPGWHFKDNLAVNVSRSAKSYRTPEPRFSAEKFPLRSTYGRFDHPSGHSEWRMLEEKVNYEQLERKKALIGECADILVSMFHPQSNQQKICSS